MSDMASFIPDEVLFAAAYLCIGIVFAFFCDIAFSEGGGEGVPFLIGACALLWPLCLPFAVAIGLGIGISALSRRARQRLYSSLGERGGVSE